MVPLSRYCQSTHILTRIQLDLRGERARIAREQHLSEVVPLPAISRLQKGACIEHGLSPECFLFFQVQIDLRLSAAPDARIRPLAPFELGHRRGVGVTLAPVQGYASVFGCLCVGYQVERAVDRSREWDGAIERFRWVGVESCCAKSQAIYACDFARGLHSHDRGLILIYLPKMSIGAAATAAAAAAAA